MIEVLGKVNGLSMFQLLFKLNQKTKYLDKVYILSAVFISRLSGIRTVQK